MLTILNLIANIFIALSSAGFMVMIQDINNPVAKMNIGIRWWIKISLACTSGGALLNVITLSTPPSSEIILNIGLAGLFSWSYVLLKMMKDKNANI
mgnify:CR=1 FL=1|jgi:hypothetical protein